ncbi:MAG: C45 family autoproteolytic acyltransferase/hydrolase [Anaerolineales bacterium]|jgi:isopenicillin-N N-acyltransferase-like protein
MSAIPLVKARGSHYEVGLQIGSKCRTQIRAGLDLLQRERIAGVSWQEMLDQSQLYLKYSRDIYPQYVQELEGIAEGAQVSFEEIFLSMCEELWESAAWRSGCTDMAARGGATADGSTLIAHTNDLLPESEDNLVLLKIQAQDEPQFLAVSAGAVGISSGFNSAGISLTGNQLDNNDIRPGVPRLLVVRAILGSMNLNDALGHCLLPQRASSYNNVIADKNGEVYCMEGSASDCEAIYIEKNFLAHSNHYLSPLMRRFEANPGSIGNSIMRYNRAVRLLRENYGKLTPELFKQLLADHAGYPASICKHGLETVTVFSIIIHLEELRAWISRGRACQAEYIEYSLNPYQPQL